MLVRESKVIDLDEKTRREGRVVIWRRAFCAASWLHCGRRQTCTLPDESSGMRELRDMMGLETARSDCEDCKVRTRTDTRVVHCPLRKTD